MASQETRRAFAHIAINFFVSLLFHNIYNYFFVCASIVINISGIGVTFRDVRSCVSMDMLLVTQLGMLLAL